MDKLKESAIAFRNLLKFQYRIILGHKCRKTDIVVGFDPKDFYHLAGLHKLKDLRGLSKDRGKIFNKIIDDEITYEQVCKSEYFFKNIANGIQGIENRIMPLTQLESIFDNNNIIFKYNKKQNIFSNIEAEYLFECNCDCQVVYIFIDGQGDTCKFCRSFFPYDTKDYSSGQMKMTLLYKEKINLETNKKEIQYNRLN